MIRQIQFRYKILRNGADLCEIHPANGVGGSITMNDSSEIKTMFMGTFIDPGDSVDWLTDQIRPELVIDGKTYPLGIFLPANIIFNKGDTTGTVTITAYDRCWMVQTRCTEVPRYFTAETNYLTAVGSLLTEAGIAAIAETKTDHVLTEAREDWNIGTPNLAIVNELLAEINYKQLWFTAEGVAVLEPYAEPSAENIQHTLDGDNVRSLLLPRIRRQTDIYSAANVFKCVCATPDKSTILTATAVNNSPSSPFSVIRRGRRIVKTVQVRNIASQADLQAYADRLRNESMLRGETIQVETALLPGYGVADVVALHYGDLSALCLDHSWSMDFQPGGTMTHQLERVVYNLG